MWIDNSWPDDNPNVAAIPAAVTAHSKIKSPEEWEYSNKENTSYLPEWANDAVFYQIFPLGYFGAPTVNDGKSKVVPRLANIRNHYKHFQELGIDAVYFSPLFESGTHGYDTFDYFEIDRRLGDVKLFKEIVKELHEINVKVVLDGVFNHTGKGHFAFQDLMKNGASDSEFANWYHVGVRRWDYEGWCDARTGSSFSYDCWEGHPVLPRLNLAEPAVRNHIFDVAKFWLEEVGIDGWRLDVAHEIEPDFWREFRRVTDSVSKDCLLVGEMIHGNYNDWVGHDRLHSGTNYQMSHATWHSLNEHNYEYFYNALRRENNLFKGLKLVNFLGNHDVPRIASNLDNPKHYVHAMVVMCLMKGIPCLYYGDEFGMEGTPPTARTSTPAATTPCAVPCPIPRGRPRGRWWARSASRSTRSCSRFAASTRCSPTTEPSAWRTSSSARRSGPSSRSPSCARRRTRWACSCSTARTTR